MRPAGISLSMRRNCSAPSTGCPFSFEHYIVDPQPDLAGRSVVVDQRDQRSAHFLELERLRLLLVHIRQVHAQVALRTSQQQLTRSPA